MENIICIFCKGNTSSSKSVEHIIPESLGCTRLVLRKGIVCDKCNNYFSSKIEGPLLAGGYFKTFRFVMDIPSKKGKIPPYLGAFDDRGVMWDVHKFKNSLPIMTTPNPKDAYSLLRGVQSGNDSRLYFPQPAQEEDEYLMARFLAKIAIEYLAFRVSDIPGWQDEVVFKPELDEIRNFSRYGKPNYKWGYSRRFLYRADRYFLRTDGLFDEILNELDFLYIDEKFLFLIVCIFGVEYAIGLTSGEMMPIYYNWLENNDGVSHIYSGKNAFK